MKTLSVTEVARNLSAVLDTLERDQEEVILVRNRRQIARLIPGPSLGDASDDARRHDTRRNQRRQRAAQLPEPLLEHR